MSDTEPDAADAAPAAPPVQPTYIYSNDMSGITPPSFDWQNNNMPHQFRTFRRYCELFLSTPTYANKRGTEIVNYILLWLGPQGVEIFDNFSNLTAAERNTPTAVWEAFSQYFEPKSNFRLERFRLRDLTQRPEEPVDSYLNRLKVQAQRCNFATADVDDNLIDQIIKGTAHMAVRKKILDQDPKTLTLDKAADLARTYEATQTQMQQLGQPGGNVNVVTQKRQQQKPRGKPKTATAKGKSCFYCGKTAHSRDQCPAKDSQCRLCTRIGHWSVVCQNSKRTTPAQPETKKTDKPRAKPSNKVNAVTEQDFESITFDAVETQKRTEAYAIIKVQPYSSSHTHNLRGKVDTGAQGNIMPLRTYRKMFPDHLDRQNRPTLTSSSSTILTAYNGTRIPQYGTLNMPCRHEGEWKTSSFYVAETEGPVIFGLPLCVSLDLVTMNCSLKAEPTTIVDTLDDLKVTFPDRFQGIGRFPDTQKLTLREDSCPVQHAPRRAPIQLRDKIKAELLRMTELDVIRTVTEPTDWVSSSTYVQKPDGSLRICLDPKDLNNALKRGQHHTPTLEELTHRFSGANIFSKLDAKHGYWSVPLEEESQLLTTFNSPFGRYCYKRLPFGLNVSQDLFQRAMDNILDGLPGVVSIADDIIVYGSSHEQHSERLLKLMSRAREQGLVFNPAKCSIAAREVTFFGHIYAKGGVRPDPTKVEAIANLKAPTSVKELQSFLGMVTYIAPFIPHLSEQNAPLRKLLHHDVEFQWHPEHQQAFTRIKQLICQAGALAYFDPAKPTVIQVDASQEALGAALTQDGRPIAFASKSLTDTEKRYANIERELLACVFGAERFHTYIYGKHFTIESDHKPLEMISSKNLTAAPARLQRMLLRLQRYDYHIIYRPGSLMVLPDSLSRLPATRETKQIHLDVSVNLVQFSKPRLDELRAATQDDTVLHTLKQYILSGFPEKLRDLNRTVRDYWPFRDELSIEDGLVLKGTQVIIPASLRETYMEHLHTGHQGVTRCQQRARSCLYWPGINKEIEACVGKCELCQRHQPSQSSEPDMPISDELPQVPWYTLGCDLLTLNNQDYLLIADYHSKYPILEKLSTSSSEKVAEISHKYFSMFGIPNRIISDNGPQFIGRAFQQMLDEYGITHVTSSGKHPKSHGFIERAVRTVKALMTKSPTNTDKALLMFRTTPLGPQLPSPAELLFGRPVPSNLPIVAKGPANDRLRLQRHNNLLSPDTRRELPELHVNQPVMYQDVARRIWLPGTVIGYGPEPRSYTVACDNTGRPLKRNRILIRPRDDKTTTHLPTGNAVPDPWEETDTDVGRTHNHAYKPNVEQIDHPHTPARNSIPDHPHTPARNSVPDNPHTPARNSAPDPEPPASQPRRSTRQSRPTRRLIEQMCSITK